MTHQNISPVVVLIIVICLGSTAFASLPSQIGTDISNIPTGTLALSPNVTQYFSLFEDAAKQYNTDPNIMAAICMQESGGINYSYYDDGSPYPAWGIMQIEYTSEKTFAEYGLKTTGTAWTLNDRLDVKKAIPYATYVFANNLKRYGNDYAKAIQAYNYGADALDLLIEAYGDEWFFHRDEMINFIKDWNHERYGDHEYVEHVLRYYHKNMDISSDIKIKFKGEYLSFQNQNPIIVNDRVYIPARGVFEQIGARVDWIEDPPAVIINYRNNTMVMIIDKKTAIVNGTPVELDSPAMLINDYTMLPIRAVAKGISASVTWYSETKTVDISANN